MQHQVRPGCIKPGWSKVIGCNRRSYQVMYRQTMRAGHSIWTHKGVIRPSISLTLNLSFHLLEGIYNRSDSAKKKRVQNNCVGVCQSEGLSIDLWAFLALSRGLLNQARRNGQSVSQRGLLLDAPSLGAIPRPRRLPRDRGNENL